MIVKLHARNRNGDFCVSRDAQIEIEIEIEIEKVCGKITQLV